MRFSVTVLIACLLIPLATPAAEIFPRPPALADRVEFWTRIYTEVGTDAGLIHDSEHLGAVYEVVRFPSGLSRRQRERRVRKVKRRYEAILNLLGAGRRSDLSADAKRVLNLWPDDVSNRTLRAAARRVRYQRGQADKFRDGIVRSGRWRDHIQDILVQQGLPAGLVALPHVESSFNPRAYSKVGAAGLWQFTRSTGQRFMRVDSAVDERMDPHIATVAAAALLRENYERTESWPLAITAYNHGAAGMMRAVRKLGTRDIDVVISRYRSRSFGFASRNFYCEFLAALDIDSDPEKFFGPTRYEEPDALEAILLDAYYPGPTLAHAFGVEIGLLQELNPALRPAIWTGKKRVPKNFSLKLPPRDGQPPAIQVLAGIPDSERHSQQTRDRFHRVQRGETLSVIARRYHTSQRTLMSLNNLRSPHRIRAGQRLRLPGDPPAPVARRPGHAVPVEPAWEGDQYRVRRGETLTEIARRVGVTPAELAEANAIRDANRIAVGQVLQIPGREKAEPSPAESEVAEATVQPTAPAQAPATIPVAEPIAAEERTVHHPTAPESTVPEGAPVAEPVDQQVPLRVADASEPAPLTTPKIVGSTARVVAEPPRSTESGAAEPPRGSPDPLPALPPTRTATSLAEGLLQIDPSRWSVHGGERTAIQPGETLGHYAEWLEVPTQRLRDLNGMRRGSAVTIGKRVRLDFSRVSAAEFEARRLAYHRSVRVTYLEDFEIKGTEEHVLRRGETLWGLSRTHYGVPVWLLWDYNPSLDFGNLAPGARLTIPRVERRASGA